MPDERVRVRHKGNSLDLNIHHEWIRPPLKEKKGKKVPLSSNGCFLYFSKTCPPMTHLCEKIISTLPSWRKINGPNQLMSLQQFVYDVQEHLNPLASETDLRHIAQQLHSIGEVSIFI